jgi:hypothetical protein
LEQGLHLEQGRTVVEQLEPDGDLAGDAGLDRVVGSEPMMKV